MTWSQEVHAERDYQRRRADEAEGRLKVIIEADMREAIESDAIAPLIGDSIMLTACDGSDLVYAMTRREARVVAARLLRAASA